LQRLPKRTTSNFLLYNIYLVFEKTQPNLHPVRQAAGSQDAGLQEQDSWRQAETQGQQTPKKV
jgi:hypothetical protein